MTTQSNAPGAPGVKPTWAPSSKEAVGTSLDPGCNLWFTLHSGIVTEVFYPTVDRGAIRDFGLLVTDGKSYFSEEKVDTTHEIEPIAEGVPGWRIVNTSRDGRYRITKVVITDPHEPVLLIKTQFEALKGDLALYKMFALLAPHLGDEGARNCGRTLEAEGIPMITAESDGCALSLASTAPFVARSCGFVGVSDGWQDLHGHCRLTETYDSADGGNIALTGEIDLAGCQGNFVLAVGFGGNVAEACGRALTGVRTDFDQASEQYKSEWQGFQSHNVHMEGLKYEDFGRMTATVLKTHDSKIRPGGIIASLSTPWGFARGDSTSGGYHVIWPRDQVEAALAMLAAGDTEVPTQAVKFLMHTQLSDGHWPQNMWITGEPYWNGVQLDETALPILLIDALRRENVQPYVDPYPMVRRASEFLVATGPCSPMDRWEENAGYSPFTLAVMVSALLAAADCADDAGEADVATGFREKAEAWNARIEDWTYVTGTPLADRCGVDGYYIRIAPPDVEDRGGPVNAKVSLKNRAGNSVYAAWEIVSPDALALVRYGLRAADDPRILNTIKVIDSTLKTETDTGPVWHRYTHDGYGETEDGSPFQSAGIGRGWPLLTGERAHYEIARGNKPAAEHLLHTLMRQTSPGGMLPEQVWDASDIPERGLFNGCPSGSAMPLVWAHAETLKLLRSLKDGRVWDMPAQTRSRLRGRKAASKRELAGAAAR